MAFNEDSRVKIPAVLHLTRLGFNYLSLKDAVRIDRRFRNKSFKRYINITQMMVFSNNMEYIIRDFERSRITLDDPTIGGMVICDSSEQAREMDAIFQERYAYEKYAADFKFENAAEGDGLYCQVINSNNCKAKRAELILHDSGSQAEIKAWVEDFKEGRIDLLLAYNFELL